MKWLRISFLTQTGVIWEENVTEISIFQKTEKQPDFSVWFGSRSNLKRQQEMWINSVNILYWTFSAMCKFQ